MFEAIRGAAFSGAPVLLTSRCERPGEADIDDESDRAVRALSSRLPDPAESSTRG
jgi:hypothetical protein